MNTMKNFTVFTQYGPTQIARETEHCTNKNKYSTRRNHITLHEAHMQSSIFMHLTTAHECVLMDPNINVQYKLKRQFCTNCDCFQWICSSFTAQRILLWELIQFHNLYKPNILGTLYATVIVYLHFYCKISVWYAVLHFLS